VATVLIQSGALHVGDPFIAGDHCGRVSALFDDRGSHIQEAGPATPVEVQGLQGPLARDQLQVVIDAAKAQQISGLRQSQARTSSLRKTAQHGLDQLRIKLQLLSLVFDGDVFR
jgi:translation initiation factor IF-2